MKYFLLAAAAAAALASAGLQPAAAQPTAGVAPAASAPLAATASQPASMPVVGAVAGAGAGAIAGVGGPNQKAVRIVCVAEDPKLFKSPQNELLRVVAGLDAIFGGAERWSTEAATKLKNLYPPVGRWHFVPLGSGFVVKHDKDANKSYVVTNWHVATACPDKQFKSPTETEPTGLRLAVLEPQGAEIRAVFADLYTEIKTPNAKGGFDVTPLNVKALCRNPKEPCNAQLPTLGEVKTTSRSEQTAQQRNVLMYVPDVAILQVTQLLQAPALVLNPGRSIEGGTALQFHGFPQVPMSLQQDPSGARRQLAEPLLTPATFARTQKFSNLAPSVPSSDVIETELMLLSGQVLPGSSGAPVLLDGEVVGMVTSTISLEGKPVKRAGDEPQVQGTAEEAGSVIPSGYGLALRVADVVTQLKAVGVQPLPPTVAAPVKLPVGVDPRPDLQPQPVPSQSPPALYVLLGLALLVGTGVAVVQWRNQRAVVTIAPPAPSPATPRTEILPTPAPAPVPMPMPAATTAAAVRLRASQGPLSGVFPLPLPNGSLALYVGRDPKACQVVFGNQHDQVGRIHCLFSWTPQTRTLTVKDLSSSNGTFVNGKRMQGPEPMQLRAGDMVDLGGAGINRFTVEFV